MGESTLSRKIKKNLKIISRFPQKNCKFSLRTLLLYHFVIQNHLQFLVKNGNDIEVNPNIRDYFNTIASEKILVTRENREDKQPSLFIHKVTY